MDDEQKKNQFDAALPLPGTGQHLAQPGTRQYSEQPDDDKNPAADLIRKKIAAAYAGEPDASVEAEEVEQLSPTTKFSKHQQFVNSLTNSGKSLAQIQTEWHEYYQKLPDEEKHEVWNEFYKMHAATSQFAAATGQVLPIAPIPEAVQTVRDHDRQPRTVKAVRKTLGELRSRVMKKTRQPAKRQPPKKLQSLLFGLAAGTGAVLIVLFGFFNERFIAPFIQPSRNVTNTPLISEALAVGSAPEIIIPKINVQIPVVYGVNSIEESDIQKTLENGVVHYANTALPGQNGNLAIVGHSSNNIFNKGKYKFAFVLLNRLEKGDVFYLQKDGKRYTYQVYLREVVEPTNVAVLGPRDKQATVSLITCDPPGTSLNRLVVVGEQISPDPSTNTGQAPQNAPQPRILASNAPSLWSRIWGWLSR
ncbi:class D sortase [Candidatus Saccharibacteria bacterium]|nr:class D sortase [Candidatus Saccharibacteria bacterium]